jgi:hypothetical protein
VPLRHHFPAALRRLLIRERLSRPQQLVGISSD